MRVLKKTGTCWVNLGDTYAGSWGNYALNGIKGVQRPRTLQGQRSDRPAYADTTFRPPSSMTQNVQPKSLCQIPSRFAIEMCNRGWILRNGLIWWKPNCMPSSTKDRFTVDFEKIFFDRNTD
ncbi:MAG: DNA methyltransferase [bacterium]